MLSLLGRLWDIFATNGTVEIRAEAKTPAQIVAVRPNSPPPSSFERRAAAFLGAARRKGEEK